MEWLSEASSTITALPLMTAAHTDVQQRSEARWVKSRWASMVQVQFRPASYCSSTPPMYHSLWSLGTRGYSCSVINKVRNAPHGQIPPWVAVCGLTDIHCILLDICQEASRSDLTHPWSMQCRDAGCHIVLSPSPILSEAILQVLNSSLGLWTIQLYLRPIEDTHLLWSSLTVL